MHTFLSRLSLLLQKLRMKLWGRWHLKETNLKSATDVVQITHTTGKPEIFVCLQLQAHTVHPRLSWVMHGRFFRWFYIRADGNLFSSFERQFLHNWNSSFTGRCHFQLITRLLMQFRCNESVNSWLFQKIVYKLRLFLAPWWFLSPPWFATLFFNQSATCVNYSVVGT